MRINNFSKMCIMGSMMSVLISICLPPMYSDVTSTYNTPEIILAIIFTLMLMVGGYYIGLLIIKKLEDKP